jgi:hypothetical protein
LGSHSEIFFVTAEILDLWGDPIPPKPEKRGRPTHVVTEEKRLRVAVLRAYNLSQPEIAEAMGISVPTLRKNYLRELRDGMAQKRAEMLVQLYLEGKGGNVAAIKEFLKQTRDGDLLAGHLASRAPQKKSKQAKLGKKEQALVDAQAPDVSSPMGNLMASRMAGLDQERPN